MVRSIGNQASTELLDCSWSATYPSHGLRAPVLGNRVIDRQNSLGEACRQIVGEPGSPLLPALILGRPTTLFRLFAAY